MGNVSKKNIKRSSLRSDLGSRKLFRFNIFSLPLISSTVSTATVYDDVMLSCDIDASVPD